MEILEYNLSREGVEALDWVRDPVQARNEEMNRICKYGAALATGLVVFSVAVGTSTLHSVAIISLPLMAVGALTIAISLTLSIDEIWDHEQGEHSFELWQLRKEEGMVQTEVEQLKKRIEEFKNSCYSGPTRSWFPSLLDLEQRVRSSAITRDEHWKALCDDLASAAAQVGRLSTQSERGHNFRSHLLNRIQKSVHYLETVSKDATHRLTWPLLLKEKYAIAYLLSWIKRPDLEIIDHPDLIFHKKMNDTDWIGSFSALIKKENLFNAIKNSLIDEHQQLVDNLFDCYKVRLDTLIESVS